MTKNPDLLTGTISDVSTDLPLVQALAMADGFAQFDGPTRKAIRTVYDIVPTGAFRYHAGEVFARWKACPTPPNGVGIALALRAAAETAQRLRAEQQISVVWTGPDTGAVPIRLTREVLLDVIGAAKDSLYIVSFAAYKVEEVVSEIAVACARGVRVRLVLETSKDDGGNVNFEPAKAFGDVTDQVEIYRWDPDNRPDRASMHVKAAIADNHTAFVTSANFTGSAVKKNMELGVLVAGGEVPKRLARHFDTMVDQKILTVKAG